MTPRPAWRRRPAVVALALAACAAVVVLAAVLVRDRAAGGPPPVAGPPAGHPRLDDLWDGRATLALDRRWTSVSLGQPGTGANGAHVEIVDGTWYLFNRFEQGQGPGDCAAHGPGISPLGTQVRASPDRGRTWGAPTPIVAPTPGTPWACAATDGDVAHADGRWRYLFQCLGAAGGWQGCVAERDGGDPAGPFTAPGPQPAIPSGALWDRICDDPGDECAGRGFRDEGTFNLLPDGAGGWWVGFHGYDGRDGVRGLARTRTFGRDDWRVDGAGGTPRDASIDAADARGWREQWDAGGPVGPGAAALLAQDGQYYQLVEVADRNLSCVRGQNWDLGLFRTPDLASTTWEQLPAGNPLVYSSRVLGGGTDSECNVLYPGLLEDPESGATYVIFGRVSPDPAYDGIYVYRLEWDRNALRNGDAWTAQAEPWAALPGTTAQLTAERAPDRSPDGTPYFALNCGAGGCGDGAAVYQDVPVDPARHDAPLAFGGALRAESGGGRVELSALQLDADGRVITGSTLGVDLTGAYAAHRGTFALDGRARRVRIQLTPRTPGTVWADHLFLIPQEGCDAPRFPAC